MGYLIVSLTTLLIIVIITFKVFSSIFLSIKELKYEIKSLNESKYKLEEISEDNEYALNDLKGEVRILKSLVEETKNNSKQKSKKKTSE